MLAVALLFSGCKEDKIQDGNTFTDTRDGKTYRMVEIGELTWMAQNLNFKSEGSLCYNNNEDHCDTYGRLYRYGDEKACPAGWRFPSDAEWGALAAAAGGKGA